MRVRSADDRLYQRAALREVGDSTSSWRAMRGALGPPTP
jgi:hypothetical protein